MRYADSADPVITLTSGPVNAYPDVLRGLARTVLYDYDRPSSSIMSGWSIRPRRRSGSRARR